MITVIIPTCDRPALLARALASVEAQTAPPARVIIVDNGHQPAPVHGPERLAVSRLRAPARCGVSRARNAGAEAADTPWLAFLDDDDTWPEDYLSVMQAAVRTRPDAHMHLAALQSVAADGALFGAKQFDPARPRQVLYRNPGIVGSNTLVRRDTLLAVGGFDIRLTCGEDRALLWTFLHRGYRVSAAPETTAWIHEHEGPRLSDVRHLLKARREFLRRYRRDMSPAEVALAVTGIVRGIPGILLRRRRV